MQVKEKPLVSVIIPTYNRVHFLARTLKSVLDQDYPNIEIIVVDDGSTDQTLRFLSQYEDIRKIFFPQHRGQCSTRNAGLDIANGKYIQMLDDDDELPLGKIKKQVEFLEDHPEVDIVYGDLLVFHGPKFHHIIYGTDVNYNLKETFIQNLKDDISPMISIAHQFTPDHTYFRISTGTGIYRKNNLRYDPYIENNFNIGADIDMWCQMILAGMKFHHLKMAGLNYNIHDKNLSLSRDNLFKIKLEAMKYFIEKYKKRCGIK